MGTFGMYEDMVGLLAVVLLDEYERAYSQFEEEVTRE